MNSTGQCLLVVEIELESLEEKLRTELEANVDNENFRLFSYTGSMRPRTSK